MAVDVFPVYLVCCCLRAVLYHPVTKLTEKIARKKLVEDKVIWLLAKISGWMIGTYILAKIIDTWYWAAVTVPAKGFSLMQFYSNNAFYGIWILILEIGICGVLPAAILISKKGRESGAGLWTAIVLGVIGVCLNRWVMVLQVLAVPVMSFDQWALYYPSWQEVATTVLPMAYGVILILISYRYLPIFPQEAALNPIEIAAPEEPSEPAEADLPPDQEMTPAEA